MTSSARYLELEQPYDCAGSAKVESAGHRARRAIESTDPTALIGLPLIALTGAADGRRLRDLLMASGRLYLVPTLLGGDVAARRPARRARSRSIRGLRRFVAENAKSARAFLKAIEMPVAIAGDRDRRVERAHARPTESRRCCSRCSPGTMSGLLSDAGCPGGRRSRRRAGRGCASRRRRRRARSSAPRRSCSR